MGKALAGGRRENVVLAVKFGPPFDADPNHRGASRRWITEGIEGSLRRLQTDWIDLYQVGVPDPNTDIDETLGALSDLVRAGKIRSFGASKVPASEIVEAQWIADRRGHGRFRTEQPPYSLLTRAIEYDVLPTCLRHGMGVMAYSPLAGGWLSGKYRKGQEVSGPGSAARVAALARRAMTPRDPSNAAKLDAADALGALADEAGMTLIQMAIAFVTRHPAVTSAIIGPRTMEHLDSYLAADGIDLSSDCSTASTRSSPRESRSTSPTTCGTSARPRWTPHPAAGSVTLPRATPTCPPAFKLTHPRTAPRACHADLGAVNRRK